MSFLSAAAKDFMGKPAPAGYIAGLGRGATGFTTRSDIGPAREVSAAALQKDQNQEDDGPEENNDDPENETGLFAGLPYEADDEEADQMYAQVDAVMGSRRAKWREESAKKQKAQLAAHRPKVTEQFADHKRELAKMSAADWDAVPEAANISRRKAKRDLGRERFVPVPDSVLSSARASSESMNTISASSSAKTATGHGQDGTRTDFVEMGAARDRVLGIKLDQVSDSVSGQSVVDPKGYLTDLNSVLVRSETEIGDIKKARLLLKSVTTSNKNHAPAWIAAARLEEIAGKLVQARSLIAQGCEHCPLNEDVWLEAARLNTVENARVILARAVRQVPKSVRIWLHASKLEADMESQKRVLKRALEFIPNSVTLWKAAISLEESQENARILLTRAVECVSLSVEMWLTLAKLETYERARKVLNKARQTIPTSHEIWIAAAQLEESAGNISNVESIISKAIKGLAANGTELTRDKWLEQAIACEGVGTVETAKAIIKHTISLGLDEEDRKGAWVQDAEMCIEQGHFECARATYANAVEQMPHKKSLWRRAAYLELEHGTTPALLELLQRAVKAVPHAEILWLMAAKEQWMTGDVASARETLMNAFKQNPASSQIWLAAVKLEQENGNLDIARKFLARARAQAGDEPRVWMKSAVLERFMGNYNEAIELLKVSVERFPNFAKLWMIWAQIECQRGNVAGARNVFEMGLKHASKSIPLWILAARLEEDANFHMRARTILERARLINPKNAKLYYESIAMEYRAGNAAAAKKILAKSLQACPTAGILWAEVVFAESRPQRRTRAVDALKKCGESDIYVVLAIARVFWSERNIDKARGWFERASKIDPDFGDTWAFWYRLEQMHGTPESAHEVASACTAASPRHGERWPSVAKALENVGKTTEEILAIVAASVPVTV